MIFINDTLFRIVYSEQDYEEGLANCTVERARKLCVEEFLVKSFLECGVASVRCRGLILFGWESVNLWMVESTQDNFIRKLTDWEF